MPSGKNKTTVAQKNEGRPKRHMSNRETKIVDATNTARQGVEMQKVEVEHQKWLHKTKIRSNVKKNVRSSANVLKTSLSRIEAATVPEKDVKDFDVLFSDPPKTSKKVVTCSMCGISIKRFKQTSAYVCGECFHIKMTNRSVPSRKNSATLEQKKKKAPKLADVVVAVSESKEIERNDKDQIQAKFNQKETTEMSSRTQSEETMISQDMEIDKASAEALLDLAKVVIPSVTVAEVD